MPRATVVKVTGSSKLKGHDDGESCNAWPEGRRRLSCLGCDAPFISTHRGNRMCERCRRLERQKEEDGRWAMERAARRGTLTEKGVS